MGDHHRQVGRPMQIVGALGLEWDAAIGCVLAGISAVVLASKRDAGRAGPRPS